MLTCFSIFRISVFVLSLLSPSGQDGTNPSLCRFCGDHVSLEIREQHTYGDLYCAGGSKCLNSMPIDDDGSKAEAEDENSDGNAADDDDDPTSEKSVYSDAREPDSGKVRHLSLDSDAITEVRLLKHPTKLQETRALLAAGGAFVLNYHPCLPPALFESGKLSSAQFFAISLCGQAHEKIHYNTRGEIICRGGFLLGDGTGCGKGRQIAAVIADNWNQGRTRAVWISCSRSLKEDARRDFNDLGIAINIFELGGKGLKWGNLATQIEKNASVHSSKDPAGGVIFATYASLYQQRGKNSKKMRCDELIEWLLGSKQCGVIVRLTCDRRDSRRLSSFRFFRSSRLLLLTFSLLSFFPHSYLFLPSAGI